MTAAGIVECIPQSVALPVLPPRPKLPNRFGQTLPIILVCFLGTTNGWNPHFGHADKAAKIKGRDWAKRSGSLKLSGKTGGR